ncbi:MAG: hypothetical protein IPL08_19660 [Saprospiraceae bacterium]|nr:hypothetical protein [Saprospiraceae bacterium]
MRNHKYGRLHFTDGCGNVADEVVVTYTWTVDAIKPVIATTAVSENKVVTQPSLLRYSL